MGLRPFMVFEIFLMLVLSICVLSFKTDTQVFIFSTRWPPRCGGAGGTSCSATGESVRVVHFDEYQILLALGITKLLATVVEMFIWNKKGAGAINQIQKVFTLGFTLSYVSYILGVNEIMVLFLFVIYSFMMASMVTIHDGLYQLGRGNRNLKTFSHAIDGYIFASSAVVFTSYSLRLYDGGGNVEAYPLVVLMFSLGYAVAARNIHYNNQYRTFPREAIKILANNGIESDADDILDRPIYLIVQAANPDMVMIFHFYTRLLDISLISFLMICSIVQFNGRADDYAI